MGDPCTVFPLGFLLSTSGVVEALEGEVEEEEEGREVWSRPSNKFEDEPPVENREGAPKVDAMDLVRGLVLDVVGLGVPWTSLTRSSK